MLRKRIVFVLTFNNGVLFRTRNFIPDYRYTANFVDAWSVDEVVILDITRPGQGDRKNFYEIVRQFSENCFVPLAAGGGVRSAEDFKRLLDAGADKIVVNTEAVRRPTFLSETARIYGEQCVVVSIDARKVHDRYEVFTEFGRKPTGLAPESWAKTAQTHGAGEVLVQSIDRDGTLEGYDIDLIRNVSAAVAIPVLACSGAGKWKDFLDAFEAGNASAACTQNIYHFTEGSIKSAKTYLQSKSICIRK